MAAAINNYFPESSIFCGVVRYNNYLPFTDALDFDCDNALGAGIERYVTQHIDEYHPGLFFMKTEDWRDEAEYRWVVIDDNDQPQFVPFGEALAGIIVGTDFHNAYLPALSTLISNDVEIRRIEWSSGHPDLFPI